MISFLGYIPKGEHYFGKPYADTCLSALANFQKDQMKHHKKMQNLRTITDLQGGQQVPKELVSAETKLTTKYKTPLKPIRDKPKEYFSPEAMQHSLSPFTMSNEDPKKFLMSGYTGFVPRARGYMGVGYPVLTNKALCEFADESERLVRLSSLPVKVFRPEVKLVDTKPIYVRDSGLVPHYTGHIPGIVHVPVGRFILEGGLPYEKFGNFCFDSLEVQALFNPEKVPKKQQHTDAETRILYVGLLCCGSSLITDTRALLYALTVCLPYFSPVVHIS